MYYSSREDSSLATKCMDFCHALANQGKSFKFSITIALGPPSVLHLLLGYQGGQGYLASKDQEEQTGVLNQKVQLCAC